MTHRQQQDQSRAHKAVLLCVIGFLVSYAYTVYPEDDNLVKWFPLAPEFEINIRAHIYYMGERFRWIIHTYAIDVLARCWQTRLLWWLEALYFLDYLFFFHDTPYGVIKGVIMGLVLIFTAIKLWKQ